ncbi:MFS transporter [Streptacidiphilus anmyonensis]|uniref:MFS transporter n=1 Tax=Streptacidiphilus anmyonensis TaxID=405782 RepID=UPI0005A8C2AE|nr:MFS transporter [Streptacidiphilus anmyonensis]
MTAVLRRGELAVTAFACGVGVAGIYYAQPLLPALAASFHAHRASAAVVVSAGQLGYAAGLLLIVPLGDRVSRGRLATALLASAVPAALLAATAPALPVLAVAVVLLGLTGSAAQVLVARTASAVGPERRGRAVGTVMGGLTAGILLARVVSGQLAALWGWRAVYGAAAVLLAAAAVLVRTALPGGAGNGASNHPPRTAPHVRRTRWAGGWSSSSPRLGAVRAPAGANPQTRPGRAAEPQIDTAPRPRTAQPPADTRPPAGRARAAGPRIGQLLLREPLLTACCLSGFAVFASFSAFWTPTAYLLAGPPCRLGEAGIGLFGLTGIAGVLLAQPAGRWCDHGHVRPARFGFNALMVVAFLPLALGRGNLVLLGVGAVLLDLGLRGVQTANQQQIYALLPAGTHSRATTAYMTCYFAGGAAGSALSAAVWTHAGWSGVCLLGAASAALPLLPQAVVAVAARRPPATTVAASEEAS